MINTIGIKKIFSKLLSSWTPVVLASATSSDNNYQDKWWKNPDLSANTADDGWKDLGDVYQDGATLSEDERQKTTHKSLTSSRKVTVFGAPGDTKIECKLMSPDLEELQRLFGGSIDTTTVSGKKIWTRPVNFKPQPMALQILAEDGLTMRTVLAGVAPRFEISYTEDGIMLVPVTIEIISEVMFTDITTSPLFVAS